MPLPISLALQELQKYSEYRDAEMHPCEGSKFHSPRPLIVHPFRIKGRALYLCGVCRDNVSTYITLQKESPEKLTWVVQRGFGNEIRRIADFILAANKVD